MRELYSVDGEARDVETVIRLRSWVEDQARIEYGDFDTTKLFTDYDAKRNVFKFKIVFFKNVAAKRHH